MKSDSARKSEKTVAKTAVEKLAKATAEEASEPVVDENEVVLDVECGTNKARLHLSKLCQGSKGPCIYFNNAWLTPNEFQYVSGRETAKDWKRSIRHFGKSIKLLMSKSTMKVDPPLCECEGCTGVSADERAESPTITKANGGAIAEQNGVKTTQDLGSASTKKNGDLAKEKTTKPPNRKSHKNGLAPAQKKNEKKIMAEVEKKVEPESDKAVLPETEPEAKGEEPSPRPADMDLDAQASSDHESGDERPSPQKESRLNNIIEGIKTKRRDVDDILPANERIPPAMLDDLEKRDDLEKKGPAREKEPELIEQEKVSEPLPPIRPEEMNGDEAKPPSPKEAAPVETKPEVVPPSPVAKEVLPPPPMIPMDTSPRPIEIIPKSNDVNNVMCDTFPKPIDNIPKLSDVMNKFNDVIPNGAKNGLDAPKPPMDTLVCPKPDLRPADLTTSIKPMDLMKDVIQGNIMNDDIRSAASILKEMLKNEAALKAAMTKSESETKPRTETLASMAKPAETKTSTENNNEPRTAPCNKCTEYNKISVPAPPLMSRPQERAPEKPLMDKSPLPQPPPKHSPYMGHLASHALLAKEREAELNRARISSSPKDALKPKTHSPISHAEGRDQAHGRIYAPVTWPPVTVDSRKDEKCPRRSPLVSESHKAAVTSTVSTTASPAVSASTSSSAAFSGAPPQLSYAKPEAATYMEYLRSMGAAYPNLLAHPGLEGTEYLAYLRRYYEWYEYHKLYPYLVPPTPCSPRMPPPVDPRAAMTSELQKQAMCLSPYSPYLYGADPRLAGHAAAGLDLSKYMCQSTRPKETSGPSSSATETPNGHLTPPRVPERKRPAESENEALDLSLKKRRLAEETKTKEAALRKESTLNAALANAGLNSTGLAASGLAAAANSMDPSRLIQGTLPTHPLGLPLYPPYWGLDTMQAGAMPAVTLPGLTPSQAFMSLPKDSNGLQMPLGFPHLSAACAGTTERERLLQHLRL